MQCVTATSQGLPKPHVEIESVIFTDSTLVQATTNHDSASIMVEMGLGSEMIYVTYKGPFYVKETKALRFKLVNDQGDDSEISLVKVFKSSDLQLDILGANAQLIDKKRGTVDLESAAWLKAQSEKVKLQFSTENKKLEEVELLSYIDSDKGVLPPKKVALYAHLKNGEKVHIRSANTIGKFKNHESYWSHTLRLIGKPKLKKILRKTVYFSLEVTPYFSDEVPQWIYIDEILVR